MTKTSLYIIKPEKYIDGLIKILKATTKNISIIYITTNRPYRYLVKMFGEHKIPTDKIFFIDCISKNVGLEEKAKNCVIVESPQNLTAIAIAINESVKYIVGKKILFLDSLSALLLYNNPETIGKFSNFLINKMRSYEIDTIMLVLESDVSKDIIQKIESFADEVKKIGN
jgi:KaiC/GvpD/RAD55 family RecA-like ATPase